MGLMRNGCSGGAAVGTALFRAGLCAALFGALIPLTPASAQSPKGAAAPAPARALAPAAYTVAPVPDWALIVEPAAPRPEDRAGIEGGAYYGLIDTQRRVGPDATHSFRRSAVTVTGRAGLEEIGRFATSFDPSDTELIVHHIRLLREGEAPRDVLPMMTLETARQEEGLAAGITNGVLTVFGDVPGLRVGDTLDVATSVIERSPHWPGRVAGHVSTEWSEPSGRNHHRVLVPSGTALTIVPVGDAPRAARSEAGEHTVYAWEAVHQAPKPFVQNIPADTPYFAGASYSSWADWNAVAQWGATLYDQDTALPDDLAERLSALRRRPKAERITAAIRIAQDEVRYMSDVVGLGAYVPRSPAVTWANGYGDCKDKTVLLIAMLRALGVEADAALANTEWGHALGTQAPTPTAFDHVIVRIGGARRPFYVDATYTLQGGAYPDIAEPDLGYVLPLTGRGRLTMIEPKAPRTEQIDVVETFDFAEADTDGLVFTAVTTRTGVAANGFRQSVDATSRDALAERYLAFYRQYYPGLAEAAPLRIEDDRDANRSVVTETYRLAPSDVEALRASFPVVPTGVMIGLPEVLDPARAVPVSLPFPVRARHEVRFLNQDYAFEDAGPVAAAAGPVAVELTQEADGHDLRLVYTVAVTGDRLTTKDLDAYRALYRTWDDEMGTSWSLPRNNFSALREALGGEAR